MYRILKNVGGGNWILYRNKFTTYFDAKDFVDSMKGANLRFKIMLETDVKEQEDIDGEHES